ncbi:MAG: DNA-formamidopyrimidine glycosylase, partial [Anaerolineae bacterium]|nr:DNA-formamidopyrimidine glycosylase [Anaerolineae bacterium]
MPELPEVETIARKLAPHVEGRTIVAVDILWARTIDRPGLAAFLSGVQGAGIDTVGRRGKFLVFTLDTGRVLLVHLRMSGKFLISSNGQGVADVHTRVCMHLDDGGRLVFSDTRKFGRFYLVDDVQEVAGNLGPEPLSPEFTAAVFEQRLAGRRSEIKRLLLDQGFVAGLGNIYASEALWHAQVHPVRAANTLTS